MASFEPCGGAGYAPGWSAEDREQLGLDSKGVYVAKVEKGAGNPLTDKVGKVTKSQVREIAEKKMVDLNAYDVDQAMRMIEGTARSMGIRVVEG